MKKIISLTLTLVLALSLTACAAKTEPKTTDTTKPATEEFKPKQVAVFTDILDNLGNKDKFYYDTSNTTVKILDSAAFKAYKAKATEIREKALKDNNIAVANTKVYTYYQNKNGARVEKDYVVVFDAQKVPTDLYEIVMPVSDKDEPSFKEIKKVDKAVDDNFKKLFADEVK